MELGKAEVAHLGKDHVLERWRGSTREITARLRRALLVRPLAIRAPSRS